MNKGSIVERLCNDLDRKEPRYKSPTLLSTLNARVNVNSNQLIYAKFGRDLTNIS